MKKKKIYLICVGKLKSKAYKETEKNILKRSKNKYQLEIIEIQSEKNDQISRPSEVEKIKEKEAVKILGVLPKGVPVITLEIKCKKVPSIVDTIEEMESDLCIVIGGSVGLSQSISELAVKKISFSDMTLPHALVRLIVLEQLTG